MSSSLQPDAAGKGATEYPMPTSQPMLLRGIRWGIIATVVSMIVFAGIGFFVSDTRGLYAGLIGAAIGGVMLLMTVGSIAFGNRFVASPMYLQIFFMIVLGAWIVKLIGFVVAALLLKNQPWLDPKMLFISLVVTVLVSIVIDAIIVARARVPYGASLPE
ncbi:3-oxoacyl-ACP reductase [Leucobacter sp. 1207-22]|uniref:3-oxoacyl-ACP reductase n=1 Tax=Leucobacter sp. 1207-22 TaxID=2604456 RepID=UPI004062B163